MKFLGLIAASMAASSSAQLVAYPNGAVAPAKTPEVQAAEAAHFAAKGALPVAAYGLPYAGAYAYGAAPYWNGAYGYNWAGYAGHPYAYAGYPHGGLVAHPNGAVVPADTPAQVAAKAQHFAAKGLPVGPIAPVGPVAAVAPSVYAPAYPGLVAHPNGAVVPAEPADVVAARAEHLAAHASA